MKPNRLPHDTSMLARQTPEELILATCECYNRNTKKWTLLPNLITGRHSAHAVVVNNCIMILVTLH
jgi:hypothetical protein